MTPPAASKEYANPDRKIWRIAGPSITSNISGAVIGLVDAWAIGHLTGGAPLAGLAVGAFIMVTIYMVFSFFYMSTVGLVAQAFGANNDRKSTEVVLRAFMLAAALGVIVILLSPAIVPAAIALWELQGDSAKHAETYLQIRLLSTPSIFLKMCASGFFIGTQRAKTALALDLFLNVLNVLLTFWLVVGLEWGIAGAAFGNLIAETAAGALGLVLVFRTVGFSRIQEVLKTRNFWRLKAFRGQITINAFFFLRMIIVQTVFSILSTSGARFGDDVLAGNHLLLQMVLVVSLSLAGIGSATQALVGAAIGASDRSAIRFWSLRTAFWCCVVSVTYAIVYILFGERIVSIFTESSQIREAAFAQVPIVGLWTLVAMFSYQMDAIFIAATAGRNMMISAAISAGVFIAAALLLVPDLDNRGLWIAFTLFFASRAISLAAFFPKTIRPMQEGQGLGV